MANKYFDWKGKYSINPPDGRAISQNIDGMLALGARMDRGKSLAESPGDFGAVQLGRRGGVRIDNLITPSSGSFLQVVRINVAAAATTTLIAAINTTSHVYTIKIYGLLLYTGTPANNITFQDNGSSVRTIFGGQFVFPAYFFMVLDLRGNPWDACQKGTQLDMVTSANSQVSGLLWFTQDDTTDNDLGE